MTEECPLFDPRCQRGRGETYPFLLTGRLTPTSIGRVDVQFVRLVVVVVVVCGWRRIRRKSLLYYGVHGRVKKPTWISLFKTSPKPEIVSPKTGMEERAQEWE